MGLFCYTTPMNIAIATDSEPKDWLIDIKLLTDALTERGATSSVAVWNDPTVSWGDFDAVLINSTWDYTDKYESFNEWCTNVSSQTKFINDLKTINVSSNKNYLLLLQDANINLPTTSIYKRRGEINLSKHSGEVVVKPLVGAGGVSTFRFENINEALKDARISELHESTDLLIQDFMHEIAELGEMGAIFMNGSLSHCVLKMPGADDFRVQFEYGGKTQLTSAPDYINNYYAQLMSILGCKPTYARIDFIPTKEPILMEVEMVEPHMFFDLYPEGAQNLANAILMFD